MAKNSFMSPDERRQQIQRDAWDAYNGVFPNSLAVRGRTDDNIKVNRCGPIVDKSASALFGKSLKFGWDKSVKKKAVQYIDDTWSQNRQQTTLQKMAIAAGVTGQVMLRLYDVSPSNKLPRIAVLDPANVSIQTKPDDIDTVLSYTITYSSVDQDSGVETKYRQLIINDAAAKNWLIVDQKQDDKGVWNQVNKETWEYEFPPIIDGQNKPAVASRWGKPDLTPDLIQINRDINFILSNMARIIRFHAHPKTVAKGYDPNNVKTAIDGTLVIPNPAGTLELLEMKGDLHSSLEMVDELQSAMDSLSRIPSIALGTIKDIPKGTVSGLALQVLYAPLVEMTQQKQALYGDVLVEVNRRLLVMAGYVSADCTITWPTVVPEDIAADTVVVTAWKALGFVSKKTMLEKLGLDPDVEESNLEDEEPEDDGTPPDGTPPPAGTTPEIPPDPNNPNPANPANPQTAGASGKPNAPMPPGTLPKAA